MILSDEDELRIELLASLILIRLQPEKLFHKFYIFARNVCFMWMIFWQGKYKNGLLWENLIFTSLLLNWCSSIYSNFRGENQILRDFTGFLLTHSYNEHFCRKIWNLEGFIGRWWKESKVSGDFKLQSFLWSLKISFESLHFSFFSPAEYSG